MGIDAYSSTFEETFINSMNLFSRMSVQWKKNKINKWLLVNSDLLNAIEIQNKKDNGNKENCFVRILNNVDMSNCGSYPKIKTIEERKKEIQDLHKKAKEAFKEPVTTE
jgi:hypothetical protein